jgi:CheY-like chemotaxis protein
VDSATGAATLVADGRQEDDPFALAIVDMDVRAMDGAEAARAIRQTLGGASLPITASGWEKDVAKALKAGANAFTSHEAKPI